MADDGLGMVLVAKTASCAFDADQQSVLAFHRSDDGCTAWSPPMMINPSNVSASLSQDKMIVLQYTIVPGVLADQRQYVEAVARIEV